MASNKLYTDLDLSGNKLLNVPGLTDVNGVFIGSAATPTPTIVVLSSATETALRNAITAASGPTTIMWSGTINLTSDLNLQGKTGLTLNCYGSGSLIRSDSPTMVVIKGNIKDCALRGINFSNTSTGSGGSMVLINQEGPVDGLHIEHSTFVNTGTGNNAISSNSSGGANDEYITSHKNVYVRYNKFGGAVMPGAGISRMAIELKNHSADGPGPIQWCERIFIDYNEIYNTGTGDADGFGISLSGLFRYSSTSHNVIVDAKRYSIESVLVCDSVIEDNDVTDIVNTSNGISLSNGYKAANALPAGSNRKMKVRNNRINVKGRAILSYYVSNSEFTANRCKSQQRNEWIGDENTIQNNRFDVYNDWNALYFANSSKNRIINNEAATYYHGSGVYTSSVIFFDTNANNSYVRTNTLTRPAGSYNVHIEQASGVSNDIGVAAGSATNTLNAYLIGDAPQYTRHVQTLRGIGSTIQYETESGTYMQINNTNSGITSGLLSLYPIAIPTQSVLTGAMMFVTNAPNFTASTGSTFSLYSYNTSTATYTLVGRTAPNTSLFKPTKASFVTANFESPITTQAGVIYFLGYIYNQDTQSAAPQIAGYTAIVGGNNEDRARLPGTSTYLSATLFASLPPATITFSQIAGAAAPRPWMAVY